MLTTDDLDALAAPIRDEVEKLPEDKREAAIAFYSDFVARKIVEFAASRASILRLVLPPIPVDPATTPPDGDGPNVVDQP